MLHHLQPPPLPSGAYRVATKRLLQPAAQRSPHLRVIPYVLRADPVLGDLTISAVAIPAVSRMWMMCSRESSA